MTCLIENETAALLVPSRLVSQLHPHFREVMQVLALQAADEARHIEVFTRRALLKRKELGLSTAGGQTSLKTLLEEPDFAIASFLLSVPGEGTFLSLLWFLDRHASDPVTATVCRLAAQDEARHVAFGMAHLREHISQDPAFCPSSQMPCGGVMMCCRTRPGSTRQRGGSTGAFRSPHAEFDVNDPFQKISARSTCPYNAHAGLWRANHRRVLIDPVPFLPRRQSCALSHIIVRYLLAGRTM